MNNEFVRKVKGETIKEKRDKNLIAIDYDGTFTEFPELFESFIIKAKEKGIRVIAATMRYESEMDEGLTYLEKLVDKLYFTDRRAKKPFLASLGVYPTIWIDDTPEWLFVDTL